MSIKWGEGWALMRGFFMLRRMMHFLLALTLVVLLLPVRHAIQPQFIRLANGNIAAPDGTEYAHLANEGIVATFGAHDFLGRVKGDAFFLRHLRGMWRAGMYSCEDDPDRTILMRYIPHNEWAAYYRKASLPEIDLSPDNCIRFELIGYKEIHDSGYYTPDVEHMSCNNGLTGKDEIQTFLADVRSQKSPDEAGLYELVRQPSGILENCYKYGVVYGFFENEVNLAIPLDVTSYNDEAYSICLGEQEFVLPEKWLDALKGS